MIPVKTYHENGHAGNKLEFEKQMKENEAPMGLLAYDNNEVIGWCAIGPRDRYKRAIKTPTYQGRDPLEDSDVWLVSCFYIDKAYRKKGVTRALLAGAVSFAEKYGASAIEGFPFRKGVKSSGDKQVGNESVFEDLAFKMHLIVSSNRCIMRKEIK